MSAYDFTYAGRPLPNPVVSDPIVLDRKPPAVLEAERSGATLRLRARDDRAGVARLQLARDRQHARPARRFRRTVPLPPRSRVRWVRVRDRAGNVSRWRAIR